jgi:hypothetical protein
VVSVGSLEAAFKPKALKRWRLNAHLLHSMAAPTGLRTLGRGVGRAERFRQPVANARLSPFKEQQKLGKL